MAKRIGKFKVTKRDSALSLEDGGTIGGDVTISGAVVLSGITSGAASLPSTQYTVFATSSNAITGSTITAPGAEGYSVLCIKN